MLKRLRNQQDKEDFQRPTEKEEKIQKKLKQQSIKEKNEKLIKFRV